MLQNIVRLSSIFGLLKVCYNFFIKNHICIEFVCDLRNVKKNVCGLLLAQDHKCGEPGENWSHYSAVILC